MDNIITKEQRMVVLLSRLTFRSEDIAEMNEKSVEESLSIILERVIRTMLNQPGEHRDE